MTLSSPRARFFALVLTPLALVVLLAGACSGPASPEEAVSEARSRYSAELNGFAVRQTPIEPAMDEVAEDGEGMEADGDDGALEEGDEGEEAMDGEMADATDAMEPVPMRTDVILDIIVERGRRAERLPGLTIDVSHVDGDRNEKAVYHAYLDVSSLTGSTQMTHVLEDVDYVEGDGFHVEVRNPVPEAERGDYREYAEYGNDG